MGILRRKYSWNRKFLSKPTSGTPMPSLATLFLIIATLLLIVRCDSQNICDISTRVNTSAVYSYRDETSGEIRVCLKCPPGSFRIGQCTSANSLNHCHCCPDNSFKYTYDNATRCQICKPHCYDHNEQKIEECTKFSDIICRCRPGYFKYGEHCYGFTACPPGKGMQKQGTPFTDTECLDCILGETYSNDTSATGQCLNCTRCRTTHGTEQTCTLNSNTVCEDITDTGYGWIAALVVPVVCFAILGIFCLYRRNKNEEKRVRLDSEEQHFPTASDNVSNPLGSGSTGTLEETTATSNDEITKLFKSIFLEISKACDRGWRMFIRSLPGNPVEDGVINAIVHDYQNNLQEQIYQALLKYRDKNPEMMPKKFCDSLNTPDNKKFHDIVQEILERSQSTTMNGHLENQRK